MMIRLRCLRREGGVYNSLFLVVRGLRLLGATARLLDFFLLNSPISFCAVHRFIFVVFFLFCFCMCCVCVVFFLLLFHTVRIGILSKWFI